MSELIKQDNDSLQDVIIETPTGELSVKEIQNSKRIYKSATPTGTP